MLKPRCSNSRRPHDSSERQGHPACSAHRRTRLEPNGRRPRRGRRRRHGPDSHLGRVRGLRALYDQAERFRSTIDMARHRFGQGQYRYFAHPLPAAVAELRGSFWPRLLSIARDWAARLKQPAPGPTTSIHGSRNATPQARPDRHRWVTFGLLDRPGAQRAIARSGYVNQQRRCIDSARAHGSAEALCGRTEIRQHPKHTRTAH